MERTDNYQKAQFLNQKALFLLRQKEVNNYLGNFRAFFHGAGAFIPANQHFLHGRNFSKTPAFQFPDLFLGQRMIPHTSVHGRSEKQRLFGAFFHIPGSDDAGEQIVAYSASQLGQGVGVERGDEHRVRPFAQFDVEDGIAALAPTRPFVLVGQDAFEARMSLDGGEIEEVRRAFRRHQSDRHA